MPRLPESFLDELKRRLKVSEVVGKRMKLRKAGKDWVAVDDQSFTVSDIKGMYHDFGKSRQHGDIFAFQMWQTGCSFEDAVEDLAKMAGLPMPQSNAGSGAKYAGSAPNRTQTEPENAADGHPNAPGNQDNQPRRRKGGGTVTAVYDYTDGDGTLLYQVCRIEDVNASGKPTKTFMQRRPAPDGLTGYVWGLSSGDFIQGKRGDWFIATEDRLERWTGAPVRTFNDGVPHSLYRLPELLDERAQGHDARTVFVCYSPDTEVLTPHGWVKFPDLGAADVAQWDMATGTVSFVTPSAHQSFAYSGDMVRIRSDWSDLLVTPDHRQPSSYMDGGEMRPPVVRLASNIRWGHKLPVAGLSVAHDDATLTVSESRLLAAWLGDGVWETRGHQVSWNLKKGRKISRLKMLLQELSIPWTEHQYASAPGWTNIRVYKNHLDFIWSRCPSKSWPWAMLGWTLAARQAALDELRYWDGDTTGAAGWRFFTGDEQSAEVISAAAAISGYGVITRLDDRRGSRNWILNLNTRQWRTLGKTPARVSYDGEVYCCTVPTGFLVVRRNGKVTISGNCEGEKDSDTLAEWGILGITNSGGASNWSKHHAEMFRGMDVVILLDNDTAGRTRGHMIGASLRNIARRTRVLDWRLHWLNCPEKADVTDWKNHAAGNAEKLFTIVDKLPEWTPQRPESGFLAVTFNEIEKPSREFEWLIKKILTRGETSLWFGAPGCGKSFLLTDAAMSISRGEPWLGYKTRRGLVVYQAGEGGLGLKQRLRAYRKTYGIDAHDNLPFVLLPSPINLFAGDADTDKLIKEINAWSAYYDIPLELVAIDTFSAASAGADENASKDVGPVLARCRRIAMETGAHVALVHHTPKGGGSPRGWSGFTGNVENVIEVIRTDQTDSEHGTDRTIVRDIREFVVRKQKDGEDGFGRKFILKQVILGRDAEDDLITSCVVQQLQGTQQQQSTGPVEIPRGYVDLPPNSRSLMRALGEALKQRGRKPAQGVKSPEGVLCVTVGDWQEVRRETLWAGNDVDDPDGKKLRQRIKKQIERTYEGGMWTDKQNLIGKDGEWVWRTERKVYQIDPPPMDRGPDPAMLLAPGEDESGMADLIASMDAGSNRYGAN